MRMSILDSQITPMLNHMKTNPILSHLEGNTGKSFSALQDILRSLVGATYELGYEKCRLGLPLQHPDSTDENVGKHVTISSSCIAVCYNITILSAYRWVISFISCHQGKENKCSRIKRWNLSFFLQTVFVGNMETEQHKNDLY